MPAPDSIEIEDARASLEYWERRRRALPLYRPAARREAREIAARWRVWLRAAEQARFEASFVGRLLSAVGLSWVGSLRAQFREHGPLVFAWALVPRRLKVLAGGLVAAWLVTALVAATLIAVVIAQAA